MAPDGSDGRNRPPVRGSRRGTADRPGRQGTQGRHERICPRVLKGYRDRFIVPDGDRDRDRGGGGRYRQVPYYRWLVGTLRPRPPAHAPCNTSSAAAEDRGGAPSNCGSSGWRPPDGHRCVELERATQQLTTDSRRYLSSASEVLGNGARHSDPEEEGIESPAAYACCLRQSLRNIDHVLQAGQCRLHIAQRHKKCSLLDEAFLT